MSTVNYDKNTFDLNPKILADYDKLDEATQKIVDNWEEIKDKAIEAQKQMEENFSTLAGNLGASLSDALIEAWTNKDLYSAIDAFSRQGWRGYCKYNSTDDFCCGVQS